VKLILSALLSLFLSYPWLSVTYAQTNQSAPITVKIYGDNDYPPYAYEKDGRMQGIYTDLLQEVFNNMDGYQVELLGIPWKRGLLKVESGEIFALYPPYYRPDSRPYMDYDLPILNEDVVAYCSKKVMQKERPNWPEDYFGLTIGNNLGFLVGGRKFHKAAKQQKFKLVEMAGSRKNLLNLLAGKVDCYINDHFSIQWELGKIALQRKRPVDKTQFIVGTVISSEQGHLGFTRNSDQYSFKADFKEKYLASLKKIQASGFIQDSIKQHTNRYAKDSKVIYYAITDKHGPPYWIIKTKYVRGILGDIMSKLNQQLDFHLLPATSSSAKGILPQPAGIDTTCCGSEQLSPSPNSDNNNINNNSSAWTYSILATEEIIIYNYKYQDILTDVRDIRDLWKKRVATMKGRRYIGEDNFERTDSPDSISLLQKIGNGSIDIGIIDVREFDYLLKHNSMLKNFQHTIIKGPVINREYLNIEIFVTNPETIDLLHDGITKMREDGTIANIVRQYTN